MRRRALLPAMLMLAAAAGSAGAQLAAPVAPNGEPTRLLRNPTLSTSQVAFEYANDIWVAPRNGGDARRITSFPGQETDPAFSPDGKWIAFSAQYGGNTDVYVVATEGGEPKRLTWHPGADLVQGWTPDGKIIFSSGRTNAPGGTKFWVVNTNGDLPSALPMPRAYQGTMSPDGKRFAYRMPSSWDEERRNYRGGQNKPIWILDLDDYDLEEVKPWNRSKELDPHWIGNTVYFISDRDEAQNVWAYDTGSKRLTQVTRFRDLDVKTLASDGRTLVLEQAGYLHLLEPGGQPRRIDIRVRGDFPWMMPQWEDVANRLGNAQLSATGKRAIFEARGDIFTVPTERGADWRNITATSGVAERAPSWSPDGRWISYFSDASGEYKLVIVPQDGLGAKREIAMPDPKFYYQPAWSPDSRRILFTDTDLRLWVVDVQSAQAKHVDTDQWMVPTRSIDPVWSPDSRWIAYAKRLDNLLHAVFVYNVESGKSTQLTDGFADAYAPAWDASGKYLYFLAGTNLGLNTGWLDMTSYDRPATRGIYLAVLRKDEPSPLLPPRGDEVVTQPVQPRSDTVAPARTPAASATPPQPDALRQERGGARTVRVDIDFDGIANRIVAVPVPERDYSALQAGVEGQIFYLETRPGAPATATPGAPPTPNTILHRYNLREREAREFMPGVNGYTLSADRKKVLVRSGQNWTVANSDGQPPQGTTGRIEVASIRMRVDPKVEFRQMFNEGWRIQRDYLYVKNLHGVDWDKTKQLYEPMLEHVAHRADFSYLLDQMGGEIAVGHSYVRGGDYPDVPNVAVGLLGADLEIANGRYRITKIYRGDPWNPNRRAPLAEPGVEVREGEYLLEVNGTAIRTPEEPYKFFEGLANRQVQLRVGPNASGEGSRVITVVPVASEAALRQYEWIENNRRTVDRLSGGRLAYVWLPNTGQGGYTNFNRFYFAQQDKDGAVIDERFNGGGSAADYIVDLMNRKPHGYFNNPVGERKMFTSPAAGIWGPKVMIINEMAGSGGDLMPYMFRYYKVGPLVGTRTWGGLVGIWDSPPLLDGGSMLAPRGGFLDINGNWAVENDGVPPDIEVEQTPKEAIAGRDPQLERAVAEAMKLLATQRFERKKEPPGPVIHRKPGN